MEFEKGRVNRLLHFCQFNFQIKCATVKYFFNHNLYDNEKDLFIY